MTKIYRFYNAGSLPCGIPGIFAGVAVEVDEDRKEILTISPLDPPVSTGAESTTEIPPQVEESQPPSSPS